MKYSYMISSPFMLVCCIKNIFNLIKFSDSHVPIGIWNLSLTKILLKSKFTKAIMWLKDTGILDKIKYDVMNPPIPIPDPTVRHKQPLILRQLGIIMIVLVVGLAIATFIFFIELCKRPKSRRAQKPVDRVKLSERHNTHALSSGQTPVIIV